MKEKKEKKRLAPWARGLIITLCVLLALTILLFATLGIYINYLMSRIERIDNDVSRLNSSEVEEILKDDPELEPVDPSESLPDISDIPLPSEPTPPVETPKHVINILLLGLDATVPNVRARSDSMILVTININAKTVTFTSFMRDSYVQIPGYAPNKLNHAYQYGGAELLCETLEVNFGVEVDGTVEIDFNSFVTIIDMLGGVDINLTEKEAWYLNHPYKGVTAGVNHLCGEWALEYARIREIDSDYQRTARQRTVLMALVSAYKDKPVNEMLDILDDIMPLLSTDMTNEQMWEYGLKVVGILSSAKYTSQRIPVDGTFSQGNVQVRPGLKAWFQYNIDFQANRDLLEDIFEE